MRFESRILSNTQLLPGYWRMRLRASSEFIQKAAPGRFVMLRVGSAFEPLLRRPFAIFDAENEKSAENGKAVGYFDILYRVVGRGTALLSTRKADETLDVLGPLGTGFELRETREEKLLVGGGIGLAPLYLLARKLLERNFPVYLFAGGRSHNDILCLAEFEALGVKCQVATEDGSIGESGLVTQLLTRHLESTGNSAAIYACGPEGMLRAVAKIADSHNLPCQVSLESRMACGIGVCLGCVVPGHLHSPDASDFRCVCADGPVFDSSELKWEKAQ